MGGAEMNGIHQNSKPRCSDKPMVPGCLGRMVNIFDLASTKSNRLLTDKPHYAGSYLPRSRSDVPRISNFSGNEMQDDAMISDVRWSSPSKKPHGTPVKMLLAQEMSKELSSKQNTPNVVARLMGLEALPQNHSRSYSQNDFEVHPHQEQNGYKDMYGIRQQSQGRNCVDKSPKKGLCSENEKKLAFIRQKFMEAKQLASDEKLRETKEWRDALDVLRSNSDSLNPPSSEIKRITVLKPSKIVADEKFEASARRNEKHAKKKVELNWDDNHNGFSPTMSMWKDNDSPTQPTRIVVLKPSIAKKVDISLTRRIDEESREAREVAKELTQRMRENLRRDETLLSSSVLSNGYIGDESSSENESEVMSPTSRNSWDYGNRYGSPYSSTSFSRGSYSPESSVVCREAKRRLSERWVMMSSCRCNQEQRQTQNSSSSTLGEMLSISGVINPEICEEDMNVDQISSPKSLLRSKSVPVSRTAYGERLNVEVSNETKMKSPKSSFAGKVSNLLFSRNKKHKKDKFSSKPQSNNESESELNLSPTSLLHSRKGDPNEKRHEQGVCYQQGGLSVSQPAIPGILGENQEQPSPISILEPSFEEAQKLQMPVFLSRSNLIDKSPPIGSISRTLSFDECCSAELTTSTPPLNSSPFISRGAGDDEWQSLVQSLLTMAGLNNDDCGPNFAKWHSLENPLDPSLREKYAGLTLHEAKRRSTQKLVFDCVNAALMDTVTGPHSENRLADRVWARAKEWVSGNARYPLEEQVEREVWKEVMGKGWDDEISVEVEAIGKEIEGKLLNELLEEWTTITD